MPITSTETNSKKDSVVEIKTDRLWKPWSISDKVISFIGEWESGVLNGKFKNHIVEEGMILEVYLDSQGLPTVGCGHLITKADNLKEGDKITLEQARAFFRQDLRIVEAAVNRRINVPLYQYEYDALVDLAFNAGTGKGFSGISEQVNQGDYSKIPDFIKTYRTGGGNGKRRASQSDLFKNGIYNASH